MGKKSHIAKAIKAVRKAAGEPKGIIRVETGAEPNVGRFSSILSPELQTKFMFTLADLTNAIDCATQYQMTPEEVIGSAQHFITRHLSGGKASVVTPDDKDDAFEGLVVNDRVALPIAAAPSDKPVPTH